MNYCSWDEEFLNLNCSDSQTIGTCFAGDRLKGMIFNLGYATIEILDVQIVYCFKVQIIKFLHS